jgi:hypothetical protein
MPKIRDLRKDHPDWEWAATRIGGFGNIVYTGDKGDPDGAYEQVEIRAYASLCGPAEDDYVSVWKAIHTSFERGVPTTTRPTESYAMWSMREQGKRSTL